MEFSAFNGQMVAMVEAAGQLAGEDVFSNEYDLQLAAELSKSLLERVKELEQMVAYLQQTRDEQETEIDLLKKQIDILRGLNESRMRMYEDIDKGLIDTERTNEQLRADNRSLTDRVKTLNATVARLDHYSRRLEERHVMTSSKTKADVNSGESQQRGARLKRTASLPIDLSCPSSAAVTSQRKPVRDKRVFAPSSKPTSLRDDALVNSLRIKLEIEKKRRLDVEKEVASIAEENTALHKQLQLAVTGQSRDEPSTNGNDSERKAADADRGQGQWVCSKCKVRGASDTSELGGQGYAGPLSPDDDDDVECDDHDDMVARSRREVIRLKNGGSAFGSRESLNLLGLETEDAQLAGSENCETILAADAIRLSAAAVASFKFATSEDEEASRDVSEDALLSPEEPGEVSLVGGLEEQYRRIVARYEQLVQSKATRQHDHQATVRSRPVSMVMDVSRQAGTEPAADPMHGHFETGPPEYKKLFNEIFETLRKSTAVVMEDGQSGEMTSSMVGLSKDA